MDKKLCDIIMCSRIHYITNYVDGTGIGDKTTKYSQGIFADKEKTSEKSFFSNSKGELNEDLVPSKYQLGSAFDSCNKKAKQRIAKKAM